MANWSKTNDYYNRAVVTQDVWSRKCSGGNIYVIDKASFTFTFSCGANSDFSMTGCLYGCSKITTVEDAMRVIDEITPIHFNDNSYSHLLEKYK